MRILFLPMHRAALSAMLPVAEALQAEGRGEPVFYLQPHLEPERAGLAERGFGAEPPPRLGREAAAAKPAAGSIRRILSRRPVRRLLASRLAQALVRRRLERRLRAGLANAERVLAQTRPQAMALSGDRHLGVELCFIDRAAAAGIRRIILPIAFSTGEGVARVRRDDPVRAAAPRSPTLNRRLAKRFPDQVATVNGETYLFYSAGETLALDELGLLPAKPWCMGGGRSTMVAVDGPEAAAALVDCGIAESKIAVTGHPEFDSLHAAREKAAADRAGLLRHHGLPPSRPIVVLAVPQLGEHKLLPWPEHWRAIDDLVGAVAGAGAVTVLSLHPKSDPARYAYLEERFGVQLAKSPLRDLLPLADLFVATFSSTVRWSLMLGVPVVLVDHGWLGYSVYDDYAGVVKAASPAETKAAVDRLIRDEVARKLLGQQAATTGERIGLIDGRARQRVVALLLGEGVDV